MVVISVLAECYMGVAGFEWLGVDDEGFNAR